MLEKPDVPDGNIAACLREEFGLQIVQVTFLPLGADLNTAVYRAVAMETTGWKACPTEVAEEVPYFVKLRRGAFDEVSVALPRFLSDQGIEHIIAPLATGSGRLWAELDAFKVILYPFVEGRNAYEVPLSDRHWRDLGRALKRIHTAAAPPALTRRLRRETYSPQGRETIRTFLECIEQESYEDRVAVEMAAFVRAKRDAILDLVGRAEVLARALVAQPPEFVVCHSDLHAGNILIASPDAFYIVDWDEPILAPKERDLMYAGGGLMGAWRTPEEEEALFYQGYGPVEIDARALAYYRYERIIQDIAVYCQQIFLTRAGGQDREQSLRYFMSNYLPNNTIDIAYRSDKTRGAILPQVLEPW
jgi:spectinomycin phosphotransferase